MSPSSDLLPETPTAHRKWLSRLSPLPSKATIASGGEQLTQRRLLFWATTTRPSRLTLTRFRPAPWCARSNPCISRPCGLPTFARTVTSLRNWMGCFDPKSRQPELKPVPQLSRSLQDLGLLPTSNASGLAVLTIYPVFWTVARTEQHADTQIDDPRRDDVPGIFRSEIRNE